MGQLEQESIDRDERLGEAIEEYLSLAESGDAPDPEQYAERYPDISEELREALDGLALVQGLVGDSGTGGRPLEAGRRVAGYRIVRELGRGGMGVVYEAVHVDLDRPVALKVLGMHSAPDSTGRRRFLNEAKTAASLHHTHIVPVFDVGQVGGLCYYAMQRIEGAGLDRVVKSLRVGRSTAAGSSSGSKRKHRSAALAAEPAPDPQSLSIECLPVDLSDPTSPFLDLSAQGGPPRLMRRRGPIRPPYVPPRGSGYYRWVAQVGRQAADALSYAHRRGVVHRDIKPSNLLVDARGSIWVADFGLARRIEDDAGLTHSGAPIGTPRYMSPEQANAAPIDERTDVYSLGATLYELITLRAPFDGKSTPELIHQITNKEPLAPRKIDPRVPRDLETVVLKAMAKRPSDRYPQVQDLMEDLERFQSLLPVRARRIGPIRRSLRFAQRHPYSTSISVVAASIVFAVATWAHLSVVRERNEAVAANTKTARALSQAEQAKQRGDAASAEVLWLAATVTRQSAIPDRRRQSLEHLRQAAHLHPDSTMIVKLRDEAVESMALRDVQAKSSMRTARASTTVMTTDGQWMASIEADGSRIVLRDVEGKQRPREINLSGDPDTQAAEPGERKGPPVPPSPRWGWELAAAGEHLAVLTPDHRRVRLLRLDGTITKELTLSGNYVDGLFATPDGTRLVVIERVFDDPREPRNAPRGSAYSRLVLWDVETHELGPLAVLAEARLGWLGPRLCISPDGRSIAVAINSLADSGTATLGNQLESTASITLHDAETGLPHARIDRISGAITALAIGPNGQLAAALHNGTVNVWDGSQTLKPGFYHDLPVSTMRYSANGTVLAVAGWSAPTIHLYDAGSNSLIATLRTPGRVHDIEFSSNGQTLAAMAGDSTLLWEVVEPLGQSRLPDYRPVSLTFSALGDLLIGSLEIAPREWMPGVCPQAVRMLDGPNTPFLTSDEQGRIISAKAEALERWDPRIPTSVETFDFPPPRRRPGVPDVVRKGPPASQVVAGMAILAQPLSVESIAQALRIDPMRRPNQATNRGFNVRVLGASDEGRIVPVVRGDELYLWCAERPTPLIRIEPPESREPRDRAARGLFGLRQVAVTPNLNRAFLIDSEGQLQAWTLEEVAGTFQARSLPWSRRVSKASSFALSPSTAYLAVGGRDGYVRIVDSEDGSLVRTLPSANPQTDGEVTSLAFGPESTLAVGSQHGRIALWDLHDLRAPTPIFHLPSAEGGVHSLAFQPQSRNLAGIVGDSVRVWHLEQIDTELRKLGLR